MPRLVVTNHPLVESAVTNFIPLPAMDEEEAALANRIAKRQRWVESMHQSCKYKTVRKVIMAGKSGMLPEELPKTPRHSMARSKRHWESMCQREVSALSHRLFDFILSSPDLRMIVGESTNEAGSSQALSCFQS